MYLFRPWVLLQSSQQETRSTSCQQCCVRVQRFKRNWSIPTRATLFPHETSVICSVVRCHHPHCSLKALDLEVLLVKKAAIMLFVFRVSMSFCKCRVLGRLLLNEITCWSVSMTSTRSASDLLKFFVSLALNRTCSPREVC